MANSGGGMGQWAGPIGGIIGTYMSTQATHKANKEARGFALLQGDIEWQRSQQAWLQQQQQDQMNWRQQNQYNEQLWNMQNQYNSPAAQMARYKEAGLNPNLIYGQSNTGGSVATANLESGSGPRGGRPGNYTPRAPEFDFVNGIMSYFQAKESAARTNNLEEQNKVLQQEAIRKAVETASIAAHTVGQEISNKRDSALLQTSVDAAQANLEKVKMETSVLQRRDSREATMSTQQLAESRQRIKNMMGENYNKQMDTEIKKIQLQMLNMGIMPHDGAVMRMLQKGVHWLREWYGSPTLNKFGGIPEQDVYEIK